MLQQRNKREAIVNSHQISACQKSSLRCRIFFQKYKICCWNPPFWKNLKTKTQILKTQNSSVENLQHSIKKLKLPAPNVLNPMMPLVIPQNLNNVFLWISATDVHSVSITHWTVFYQWTRESSRMSQRYLMLLHATLENKSRHLIISCGRRRAFVQQ